jgi:hypothetical protein
MAAGPLFPWLGRTQPGLRALSQGVRGAWRGRLCCILVLPVQSDRSRGITRRRRATQVRRDQAFKGRQFTAEVILLAVRLDVPHQLSDLELMLLDRGVEVDHTTIFRWIQACAAELESGSAPTCA